MAGQKTASMVDERMKAIRIQVDMAFNAVEMEIARLREQLNDAMTRIEALEGGEVTRPSD